MFRPRNLPPPNITGGVKGNRPMLVSLGVPSKGGRNGNVVSLHEVSGFQRRFL